MPYGQDDIDAIQRDCLRRLEMARTEYKWKHNNSPPNRLEIADMEARLMARIDTVITKLDLLTAAFPTPPTTHD